MESCHQGERPRLYNQAEQLSGKSSHDFFHKDFVSHSGVQRNFTKQLYMDLHRIYHFDECLARLRKSKYFPSFVTIEATKQCRVAIVVLSNGFFTYSKWPMIELNEFVQAKESSNRGLEILPLFFGITIAEFNNSRRRKDWEDVWQGFADKEEKGRIDVKKWVYALSVLDGLNGMEFNEAGGEVAYRQDVVATVCRLIPPVSNINWDPSNVQSRQKLCEPILQKLDEAGVPHVNGACVVGLYGTSGVGKTTIAEVLCKEKFGEFVGKTFHMDLGSLSPKQFKIVSLQSPAVYIDGKKEHIILRADGDELGVRLRMVMLQQRVFLVLDDVQDHSIEEALRYLGFSYRYGSKILVISQSRGVLERLGISDGDCIEMPELDQEGATKVLLSYSRLPQPLDCSHQEVIARCVEACRFLKRDLGRETCTHHYHSLALKFVGSQLGDFSNNSLLWTKLSEEQELGVFTSTHTGGHPFFDNLRKGYDSLRPWEQHIFLDLALNVVPRSAWYSNSVWEWLSSTHRLSRVHVRESLQSIWRKGLIEDVREDGLLTIKIHDLFVALAREVQKRGVYGSWHFVLDVGGSDVPESLSQISGWPRRPPARVVIRNSTLRSLKGVEFGYNRGVKALQILDCELLEEVDVQGMVELRSLEIFGCPRLGEKFQGLEKLTNLAWLSWKDVPKSVPVTSHLSSLPSLQFVELDYLPDS